jgi:hypothetical protein
LKVAIADVNETRLSNLGHELSAMIGRDNVLVLPTDVAELAQVIKLRDKVYDTWGEVSISVLKFAGAI